MSVKDIDKGFQKIITECKELGALVAVVGVFGEDAKKTEENGVTVLDVAKAHEFGAPAAGIPERSFLRQGVTAGKDAIARRLKTAASAVLDGRSDARTEVGKIGELARASILKQFKKGGDPKWQELKPATVRRRRAKISPAQAKKAQARGDNPAGVTTLVDDGQLRQSIHSEVRDR